MALTSECKAMAMKIAIWTIWPGNRLSNTKPKMRYSETRELFNETGNLGGG